MKKITELFAKAKDLLDKVGEYIFYSGPEKDMTNGQQALGYSLIACLVVGLTYENSGHNFLVVRIANAILGLGVVMWLFVVMVINREPSAQTDKR